MPGVEALLSLATLTLDCGRCPCDISSPFFKAHPEPNMRQLLSIGFRGGSVRWDVGVSWFVWVPGVEGNDFCFYFISEETGSKQPFKSILYNSLMLGHLRQK
ncbi:hypothetical protein B0H65DRAFT_300918 [Neurospora tetraspora]|uniref:Uncharacterized protein n=1 Tax=Neurospora tetraspora TaxID=94610 RepID=A0AAE0J9I7_9PEZI|nr:hypothetical protein B0H65DRAFT_300918 [Neurospora tetraspora]